MVQVKRYLFVSRDADKTLLTYLKRSGFCTVILRECENVYPAIQKHADITLCSLPGYLVASPLQYAHLRFLLPASFVDKLICGASEPGGVYPATTPYNAVQIGNLLIHNLQHTDRKILKISEKLGLIPLHVRQGYTRCNVLAIDSRSAITSDRGVSRALQAAGIDVLEVVPGHVKLPGFPCGFLGGASGCIGDNIVFHGDLSAHPDFHRINDFISRRRLGIVYFKEFPLTDIGSIIEAKID